MYTTKYRIVILIFILQFLNVNIIYADANMDADFKDGFDCSPSGFWDKISPPYNRNTGRGEGSCLRWYKNCPGTWEVGGYFQYCAQSTTDSSYFDPKIKVQFETCNFACWSNSATLRGFDGECKIFPTGYAIPTVRICARIARPVNAINKKADPGMVATDPINFVHKNYDYDGKLVEDEKYTTLTSDEKGEKKEEKYVTVAKLCAYDDPGVLQGLFNLFTRGDETDFFDIYPNSQPVHEGGQGTNPVIDALNIALSFITNGPNFIASFAKAITSMISGTGIDLSFLEPVIDFICNLVNFFGSAFADFLKQYLKVNRIVHRTIGCVNVPLGPYPPPYCDKISKIKPPPVTFAICRQYDKGTEKPSEINNCILSNGSQGGGSNRNNIIHNTIRVAFPNLIPLCKGDKTDKPGSCVNIIRAYNLAKLYHDNNDNIPVCLGDLDDHSKPCVEITEGMQVSKNVKTARVIYGLESKSGAVSKRDYYPDINKKDDLIKKSIVVWGVDASNFRDITVDFSGEMSVAYHDESEISTKGKNSSTNININTNTEKVSSVTLEDPASNSRDFTAVVVLDHENTQKYKNQSMTEICVYEKPNGTGKEKKIGCQSRLPRISDTVESSKEDPRTLEKVKEAVKNDINNIPVSNDLKIKILSNINNIKIPNNVKSQLVNDVTGTIELNSLKTKISNNPEISAEVKTAILKDIDARLVSNDMKVQIEGAINNAQTIEGLRSSINSISSQIPQDIKNKIMEDVKDQSSDLSKIPTITYLTPYMQKPLVYNNRSSDDYFQPQMKVQLCGTSDKQDCVFGIVEAPNRSNKQSYKNKINLAGFVYDAFVTDNDINTIPFSGKNSGDNGTSLNTSFLTSLFDIYPGLVYKKRLYIFGGKKICINNIYAQDCPNNKTHCVLAKTINYEISTTKDGAKTVMKTASSNPLDRIDPKADNPSKLLSIPDSQFFDLSTADKDIKDKVNDKTYSVRNKTPFEENLCVDMDIPHCKAITEPVSESGNATWSEVELGEWSVGKCREGFSASKEIKRRCGVFGSKSADKYVVGFEPIDENNKCKIVEFDVISTNPHMMVIDRTKFSNLSNMIHLRGFGNDFEDDFEGDVIITVDDSMSVRFDLIYYYGDTNYLRGNNTIDLTLNGKQILSTELRWNEHRCSLYYNTQHRYSDFPLHSGKNILHYKLKELKIRGLNRFITGSGCLDLYFYQDEF